MQLQSGAGALPGVPGGAGGSTAAGLCTALLRSAQNLLQHHFFGGAESPVVVLSVCQQLPCSSLWRRVLGEGREQSSSCVEGFPSRYHQEIFI